MVNFKKVEAIPLSRTPAKVVIRWETNAQSPSELKDYEFLVLRQSSGQDGQPNFQDVDIDGKLKTPVAPALDPSNLTPISTWIDGLEFPWHIDYSDTLKNLTLNTFYKVKCRHKQTQEEVSSPEFTWEGDLDLVGLYVVDEHNFLIKDAAGVPSLVYQRRRGGLQCTCVDPIQKKRLTSSCKKCYGTNWVGGFFIPIDTYIDFSPTFKNASIQAWGEANENETDCLMSNFPNVTPGDVIREMPENRLWRVVRTTPTEKRRCQMLQFSRLTEIKAGDVEYSLPFDERFLLQKLDEFGRIRKKTEF